MIFKGCDEANNKFLKLYRANKPILYIIYLDANNLYKHSPMQLLPTEIHDWINPKDFNLDNYSNDCPIGHFLEFDFDYADKLHDLHNDYPLAGEKIELTKEVMSDYQLQITENNIFFLVKKKLIPNLGNKKYKLCYQNLKLYLCLGLRLEKT